MNERQQKMCIKFLNDKKPLVGLTDWYIEVFYNKDLHGNFAEVKDNIMEKTITIRVSTDMNKFKNNRIKSILMHELLHVRFAIFEKRKEMMVGTLEEEYINDLERGFMSLMNINTQEESLKK